MRTLPLRNQDDLAERLPGLQALLGGADLVEGRVESMTGLSLPRATSSTTVASSERVPSIDPTTESSRENV